MSWKMPLGFGPVSMRAGPHQAHPQWLSKRNVRSMQNSTRKLHTIDLKQIVCILTASPKPRVLAVTSHPTSCWQLFYCPWLPGGELLLNISSQHNHPNLPCCHKVVAPLSTQARAGESSEAEELRRVQKQQDCLKHRPASKMRV